MSTITSSPRMHLVQTTATWLSSASRQTPAKTSVNRLPAVLNTAHQMHRSAVSSLANNPGMFSPPFRQVHRQPRHSCHPARPRKPLSTGRIHALSGRILSSTTVVAGRILKCLLMPPNPLDPCQPPASSLGINVGCTLSSTSPSTHLLTKSGATAMKAQRFSIHLALMPIASSALPRMVASPASF